MIAGLRYEVQRLTAPFGTSTRNLAPRLGVAWQPHSRGGGVFRARAGLFYDRYPLAYLNDAIQKDRIHGFQQYAPGPDPVRIFTLARRRTLTPPVDRTSPARHPP